MNTISNSELTLNISSHGAELHNIIKDNKEYLWQGDPKYWADILLFYFLFAEEHGIMYIGIMELNTH